jgi:pimeloyl-ACP methyl ester carboxylesterase
MKVYKGKFDSGDYSMDYSRFGNGPETFVILPGISVQSVTALADAISGQYRILSDDFTVYLFDRRNEMPEHYSVHDMAEDTVEAINSLGLKDLYIFGTSQGGMIAMDMAVNHPELVKKIAVGSTAARLMPERFGFFQQMIDMCRNKDAESLYLLFGETIFPEPSFEMLRNAYIEAAKTVTDEEMDRFAIMTEGMENLDMLEDLDKIKCPVLLIHDKKDKVFPMELAEEIIAELGSRSDFAYHIYDGYGHVAYDMAPDYRERLLSFMKAAIQ